MVASGCGGTGRELEPFVELAGLDFVTRSITLEPRQGTAVPRVEEVAGGLCHSTGLPNPGLEHFLATELPWLVRAGVRVVVSVAGSTLGDYVDLARRLGQAPGVLGLEVNLGAPDAESLDLHAVREPFQAASVIAAVRREFPSDLPVLAKVRTDPQRVVETVRVCAEAGATAVVVGHALPALMHGGVRAGLSGPGTLPVTLRCVAEAAAALPDVTLIGSGGVNGLASARRYFEAGARHVQVGAALLQDPTTLARLRAQLEEDG